jgi:hypothetical protein
MRCAALRSENDPNRAIGALGTTLNAIIYPDEPGLRNRIRFTSSEFLKSSRTNKAQNETPEIGHSVLSFTMENWWSQPGSNR